MPLTRLPGSATTHGPSFEYKLAALLALRATRQGLRFRLYSNVAAARPMDDLVLRVNDPDPVTYFVQLKHAKQGGHVDAQAFLNKGGDYSISKYYDWFRRYQEMYNHRHTLSHPDECLLTSWKMEEARFILYTNKKVEHSSSKSPPTHAELPFPWEGLLRTGEEDNVFSFQDGDKVWDLLQDDSFRNEFLPRVKILGAQAHVNELDDLIRKELDQLYGKPLKRSEKYAKEYIEAFRKWAEESSQGDCITESSEEMQKIIAEDLRACAREAAQGAGLAFQERQCPFADADCPFRARSCLRHAVARSAATLLRVPGVAAGLRAARAQQLLDRDFPGRWAYVDERSLKEFPAAALAAACSVCDVVVLDVNKATKPLKDLFDSVCPGERKCVILTDSDVVKKYLLGERQCSEVVDDWALDQLTDEAQETFMDTALEFQGRALSLRELERAWPSVRRDVDGALLGRLAQGDAAVGAAPSWADADALHHLPRTLAHSSRLSWDVLRLPSRADHLVLHGFSREDVERLNAERAQEEKKKGDAIPRIEEALQERFTVLDEKTTESALMEKFEHSCSTNGPRNVHLLEKVGGSLVWRASRGNTAAVAEFVQPLTAECTPHPLCPHRPSAEQERVFESGRVQLLLGEPGIGKSSFLQRLAADARAQTPPRWAVVVKLLDHDRLLDAMPEAKDMGEKDVVDLVAAAAVGAAVDCRATRCSVEVALLHSGAIHLFVDGLDEVLPALEIKALRFLELLMETRAERIWIASRQEVGNHLRRTVGCAPLQLLPLSRHEQVSYLTAHWITENADTSDAVQEVARKMVKAFAQIPSRQSQYQLATPLALQHILRMLIHELHKVLEPVNIEMLTTGKISSFDDEIISNFNDVSSTLVLGRHLDVAFLIGDTLGRIIKMLKKSSNQKKVYQIINSKQQEIVRKVSERFDEELFKCSLLAIPLHLRMAAEAYAEKVTEAVRLRENINMTNISQLELFTHFINKKREQCKQRYGTDRPAMWDEGDDNAFHDVHQYYAMSIFSAALPGEIRCGFQQTKKEEYQKYITKDKTDILCKTENGRPQFTHSSFMEYFVAAWMFKKYQSLKKASTKTLKPYLKAAFQWKAVSSVLFFFDLMLADESPLHNAVLAGDEAVLRACLATSERADRVDEAGRSALHLAASYGRAGAVLALLDSGATLELRDRLHNWTPLEYADAALELEAAEQLLRRGGDPRQLVNTVRAAIDTLMKAAQFDLVEIMRKMMFSEARAAIFSGFNVLEMQVHNGPENYKEEGTNKKRSSTCKRNDLTHNYIEAPIHRASAFGSKQVIELLLKAGVNVNIRTANQRTPLHLAASQGHQEIVQHLLKAGAEIDAKDDLGLTSLHLAAHNCQERVVRILILYKAAINSKANDGRTALLLAAFKRHRIVADILLESGAQVDLCTDGDVTPLHAAAHEGSSDVVELLLSHNADVNRSTHDGSTPLHCAALRNHKHVADLLLQRRARVDSCNNQNFTPLHAAVQEGNRGVVQLLLSHNADVNRSTHDGSTPLHFAALKHQKIVAELLLRRGARVTCCSDGNFTPLHTAAQEGSSEVVELLLSHNAEVNRSSDDGSTPLHLAALRNHKHVANLLLQCRARVDSCNNEKYTPLHVAAQEGSCEVAELLLSHNADVNRGIFDGSSPLHLAAGRNRKAVADLLLRRGAHVDSCNNENYTPLHAAAQGGSCEVAELLLSQNGDVNRSSDDGSTPLHLATLRNHKHVAELLLWRGARVNCCTIGNFTPLHLAAQEGSSEVAEILLSHNADIDRGTVNASTPLHLAALKNHKSVAELLLRHGARVDSCDSYNATPLHIAAQEGSCDMAELLLSHNADINSRCDDGSTPLHLAALRNHKSIAELLLHRGACVDSCNSKNDATPLHIAAQAGSCDVAKLLLIHNADVNKTGGEINGTPLHFAACSGQNSVVEVLLEAGARVNARDLRGCTAMQLAGHWGHKETVAILVSWIVKME